VGFTLIKGVITTRTGQTLEALLERMNLRKREENKRNKIDGNMT